MERLGKYDVKVRDLELKCRTDVKSIGELRLQFVDTDQNALNFFVSNTCNSICVSDA